METFYYVYKVGGGRPTYKHETYELALREAQRLIDSVGGEFYILKAEALVKAAPKYVVQETISRFRGRDWVSEQKIYEDGIPF